MKRWIEPSSRQYWRAIIRPLKTLSLPFENIVSTDIPSYAKERFKEINALGQLHRENAPVDTDSRVDMRGALPISLIRASGKN